MYAILVMQKLDYFNTMYLHHETLKWPQCLYLQHQVPIVIQ